LYIGAILKLVPIVPINHSVEIFPSKDRLDIKNAHGHPHPSLHLNKQIEWELNNREFWQENSLKKYFII